MDEALVLYTVLKLRRMLTGADPFEVSLALQFIYASGLSLK